MILMYETMSPAAKGGGEWSGGPPPYGLGIAEREFLRLKEQWLYRSMTNASVVASHRVVAYLASQHLNWATMDWWVSDRVLAQLAGWSEKTVQRAMEALEDDRLISAWRLRGGRQVLRCAPIYSTDDDSDVHAKGHGRLREMDTSVHQSSLSTQLQSSLRSAGGKRSGRKHHSSVPSFIPAHRGSLEIQVANALGGYEALWRLALIDDAIVTRLCEAQFKGIFDKRLINAARLAAKQVRASSPPSVRRGRG
jgi:hypothetical protein